MSPLDFYQKFLQALHQGAVVLATVIDGIGSVPREVGAKMIISAHGQTYSTIGGGAGEAKVIRQSLIVLETGEKQSVEIDLSGASHRETQGVCGGRMRVWLERWQGEEAIALIQHILEQLRCGQPIILVTPLTQQTPYLQENALITSHALTSEAFIETIQPPPLLLIVGAGHVGEKLAIVAHLAGFQIAVQDNRPDLANAKRFSSASLIFNDSVGCVVSHLNPYQELYAALVTRGYQYDLEALQILLRRKPPCRYIGMIGSQKRVRQVLQSIQESEFSSQTIHAPIGLSIGALTPEEIAISITAELIMVRRQKSDRPLERG